MCMAKRTKGKTFAPKPNKYLELLKDELKKELPQERYVGSLTRGQREQLNQQFDIRTIPICWGIPFDELMYSQFFGAYALLVRMPWDSIVTTMSTYLPDARNEIHRQFCEDTDAPYLMMLDSDTISPSDLIRRLIAHKKHLVGGWYNNKPKDGALPHPVVYKFDEETDKQILFKHYLKPGTGLERVDGMGAGCWLMSRELAEALGPKPYSMHKATEDLVLSREVMKLGYEMYVDWDINCLHLGVGAW